MSYYQYQTNPLQWQVGHGAVYIGQKYQYGRGMSVFKGQKYQYGDGLGDILRGIGRFLLPILAPIAGKAAGSFINNTTSNLAQGHSFKDSLKESIRPTLADTVAEAKDVVSKRFQSGSGFRKRRQFGRGQLKSKMMKYERFQNPPERPPLPIGGFPALEYLVPPRPPQPIGGFPDTYPLIRHGAVRRKNQRGKGRKRVYKHTS